MRKKYEISDDGSIFNIGDDGTIHRIGKIDSQGNIEGKTNNSATGFLWFFLVVAIITVIILAVNLSNANSDLSDVRSSKYDLERENSNLKQQNSENSSLKNENSNLRSENSSLKYKFDDLREKFPLKITRIEMGYKNSIGNITYGSTLYSSAITYLYPKIYFTNYLKSGKTFNFTINYYNAKGHLEYNTSNGNRPTDSGYISTSDTEYGLSGWGSASGGSWSSGIYTVEIWSDGVCLGSKKFTIY